MKSLLRKSLVFLLMTLLALTFVSCGGEDDEFELNIDNNFYWALSDYNSTVEDAQKLEYKHLDRMGYKNLRDLVGKEGAYVWLKAEFEIPEELKNEDLSMVIPYLHFADILYLNGKYIDDYGVMGESVSDRDMQEAGYGAHLFDFPELFLHQDGVNTVLIKVWALGSATISEGVFISLRQHGWSRSDNMTFWRSRVYVFFEGIMFATWLFFLLIYLAFKKEKAYRRFANLNLLTMIFFSNFFVNDLPWAGFHGGVSFFTYIKFAKCLSFFGMEFAFTLFIFDYLECAHHRIEQVSRYIAVGLCVAHTLFAPDYTVLMGLTHRLLAISGIDLLLAIGMAFRELGSPRKKEKARFLLIALIPLVLSIVLDFVIKGVFRIITIPYFSLIGWQIFILIVLIYFSLTYNRTSARLEYLSRSLEDEVEMQTRKLKDANLRLENEQEAAQEDMYMAAIVQKKFFHAPKHSLKNWEFSVRYEPLSIVSGDLFNFYHEGDELKGISLFDASGHGVAASLVTMLAENIIQQSYRDSLQNGDGVAKTLEHINERFIDAKGSIENYLTGILLNTRENDDGSCTITIANAGHPTPVMYVAENGEVEEILPDVSQPSVGAVGIADFEVSYGEIEFNMRSGDVLLLYTDGLLEMMNENGEEFGINRAMSVLNEIHGMSATEMISALMFAFNAHVYNVPRTDDVSVIILKRK